MATEEKATAVYPNTRLRLNVLTISETTAKARQHHDVDAGVGIKPEKMLKQQRIAALRRIEYAYPYCPLKYHQRKRNGEDRRCQHHDDGCGRVLTRRSSGNETMSFPARAFR